MLVAACVVALEGCALGDVPVRTPAPDAVRIRVYTSGGEGGPGVPESVRWMFQSVGSGAEWGVVTHIPEADCITIGARWSLTIDDNGRAVPLNRSRHDQFSGASPLDLIIDRAPTGRVTVREGLPDWMSGKPVGCAPL
jgi:hypothetical protein